ncbi:MAG: diguanylate cyclase [Oceanicoccus sp.]
MSRILLVCISLGIFLLTSPESTAENCISLEKSSQRNIACWDFQSPIPLDGAWDILPGFAPPKIDSEFLSRKGWISQNILQSWEQSGFPGSDFQASYKLSLNLPKKAPQLYLFVGESYSNTRIEVRSASGQFIRIFANATEKNFETYQAGRLSSRVVALPPLAQETTIVIQVSNGPYLSGGFYEPPVLGTLSQLNQWQERKYLFSAISLGAFVLLGLINFSLWLARKTDMAQLILAGLALTMALRLIDTGKLLYLLYPDAEISWFWRIGWYTVMLLALLWSAFIRSLLPRYFPQLIHRVATISISICGIILLISGSDYWLQTSGLYIRGLIFVILLFSMWAIAREILDRGQSSRYFLVGVSALGITAIIDVIGQNFGYPLNTTNYGFLVLVLFQTINLNKHYVFALTEQERLTANLEQLVEERTEALRVVNRRLKELAETDELTGLSNRRMFFFEFKREKAIAERGREVLSLAILDIDFFKSINDRWGHDAGDMTLKEFGSLLETQLRATDVVARVGGEEFAFLMRTNSYPLAIDKANKICGEIGLKNFSSVEGDFQITASIGICEVQSEDDVHSAMKRADTALYEAKNKGRNQVISN